MTEPNALTTRMQTVKSRLESDGVQAELARVLTPQGMDAARFARIAYTAVLRQPKLAECDWTSFGLAIMESAALGLEIDSVSGMSYLVPFKGRVQLIVGYRGMVQLAYRHPKVTEVGSVPIFEQDEYVYEEGLTPRLKHRPKPGVKTWDTLIACYARARIVGGGHPFRLMFRDEIEEHRARSSSWKHDQASSPWSTDGIAMAMKTPIRALAKMIPLSPQLQRAIAIEADPETERPMGEPPVPHGTSVEGILDAIAADQREPVTE